MTGKKVREVRGPRCMALEPQDFGFDTEVENQCRITFKRGYPDWKPSGERYRGTNMEIRSSVRNCNNPRRGDTGEKWVRFWIQKQQQQQQQKTEPIGCFDILDMGEREKESGWFQIWGEKWKDRFKNLFICFKAILVLLFCKISCYCAPFLSCVGCFLKLYGRALCVKKISSCLWNKLQIFFLVLHLLYNFG